MKKTQLVQLVLAFVTLISLPVICEARWNIEKAREIGEDAISGPTAQTFRNDFEKAKYVMGQLGEALAQNRVVPNGTYFGRVGAKLTTGNAIQGNCQWCAETLQEALKSAGVSQKNMFIVHGNVKTLSVMGLNIVTEVNRSHAALAVVVDGKVLIFDLWKHGMENKSFANAKTSKWNGVSLPQWVVRLKHYEWFGFMNPSIDSKTTTRAEAFQRDLIAAWKTINKQKKQAPPKKSQAGGVTRLKSGTYSVEAGGAMLRWDIEVSSSGTITGMCNGSESLTGTISGNELRIRRACPGYEPPHQDYSGTRSGNKFTGTFRGAGVVAGQNEWIMLFW